MALLDSGCHRTVCGERWLANFTSYLSDKERRSIHIENSSAIYRFGDGEQKKALRCVTFPCRFGGKRVNIKTDIIDSAIPLLMSRHSMKTAGMIINMAEDTAVVFGDTVKLRTTSTGHYTLPLFSDVPHYGSPSLSGVREHSCTAFKSAAKKEKAAREDTRTSCPHRRSVCSKAHRRRHDFDSASSPHGCQSAVVSRPLRPHGERPALL